MKPSPILRAFAFLLAATAAATAVAQPASPVTTDEVIRQPFTQTVPIIGRLLAKQAGDAAARIAGTVAEMRVQVGERVSRGRVLAVLDTAELQLRLQFARAQHSEAEQRLATSRAQLALASQELKRLSGLTKSAAVSRADFDDASQRFNIASARMKEANAAIGSRAAEVSLAQLNLDFAEVRAPFDGVVTALRTEVGSYLQRGQSVAQLVSDRRLEVEADVPYNRLGGVVPGAEVAVVLDDGSQYVATVRAVVPEEDPRTRTRRVRFSIDFATVDDDAGGGFASEQSVTVLIPAGTPRNIISVHKDAVVQRGPAKIVFVVEDGAAALRPIQAGEASGNRIEVLDGLQPGDAAVVRGNERLQPGQPVAATALPPP